jgi:TonB family protein
MSDQMTHRPTAWLFRLLVSTAILAILAPAPGGCAADDTTNPSYGFDVVVKPGRDKGQFDLVIRLDRPDRAFSTFLIPVSSAPSTRTVCMADETRTHTVTVKLGADGSAYASLTVTEGARVIATAMKSYEKPNATTASNAVHVGLDDKVDPPKVVSRVEPTYTAEAKQHLISGICIVQATIDANGVVEAVEVIKSLPYGLDKAAIDAVRQWRFKPATKDGKPIRADYNIVLTFRPPADQRPAFAGVRRER